MKQTSSLTQSLSDAQERRALNQSTRFRIYTQDQPFLQTTVDKYFKSYCIKGVDGVYRGDNEAGAIIEILGPASDRLKVVSLAKDIKSAYKQDTVLVTHEPVNRIDI